MVEGSPTVRRRRLGLILRELRERRTMTGEEVGLAVERSASWLSRVETGRVGLRVRDLRDLLDVYEVDDLKLRGELEDLAREGKQRGWWSRYADTISGPYATYIGFEAEASALLIYEPTVVHGLLQTEDYARAIARNALPPRPRVDDMERLIKVRMARQDLIWNRGALRLWVILDESVLHRRIGGPAVQRGQLKRLREAARMPHVTLQVVPFVEGANPGQVGPFTIIQFPEEADSDVVYLEGWQGDIFPESGDVAKYHEAFDFLRAAAAGPTETIAMIEEVSEAVAG